MASLNSFAETDHAPFEIAQANIASDVRDVIGDDSIKFGKYERTRSG